MKQVSKYRVRSLGSEQTTFFSEADNTLIPNYVLENTPFLVDKYRLNINFYDLNQNPIEIFENVQSYKVLGNNKASEATQISVDPVQDCLSQGYLGDVIVGYEAFNDIFSPDKNVRNLWIHSISSDRTEIRAKSFNHTDAELKEYVSSLQSKLLSSVYVSDIKLCSNEAYSNIINALLELTSEGETYVTLKLYEPLPPSVTVKSEFCILERIGELELFEVTREVEIIADSYPKLQKPNFTVNSTGRKFEITDYKTYDELLSSKASNLAGAFNDSSIDVSIDHTDFSDFIHFSSAAERLQNFKYKFDLISEYQSNIEDIEQKSGSKLDIETYQNLIEGIISNFDHYDRFLYFESGSHSWPKKNSVRPFENETDTSVTIPWFLQELKSAENYDDLNSDILTASIPQAIREDSNNEPYLVFVHMIGQHFDNEWVYAKAVSRKYKADNRPNFGISKDLVWEAIRSLGISLSESGQNLTDLFETSKEDVKRITEEIGDALQPLTKDEYAKEVYKRIYHNLPILLKSKGTNRGLRTLINCFGIPDSILSVRTLGGVKTVDYPYLGPQTPVSESKIRLDRTGSLVPNYILSGSFETASVLSSYVSVQSKNSPIQYSDDSHEIVLGFELNKQFNSAVYEAAKAGKIDLKTIDSIIGDPRNFKENYGNAFSKYIQQVKEVLKSSSKVLLPDIQILWLVRYFDSMFFRSLKSFVAARDSISTGAIVEDNVLHRNRYRGVGVSQETKSYSGTIETDYITGSHGGAYDFPSNIVSEIVVPGVEEPITISEVNTAYELDCASGVGRSSKLIYDQSPKYNGELSGSYIQVSDMELNSPNNFKKLNVNQPFYVASLYSLNLPSPALCRTAGTEANIYSVPVNFYLPSTESRVSVVSEIVNTTITSSATVDVIPTYPKSNVSFTTTGSGTYLGWYSTSSAFSLDSTTPIFTDDYLSTGSVIDYYSFEEKDDFSPRYSSLAVHDLLFLLTAPVLVGPYYYFRNEVLLSWSSSYSLPKSLGTLYMKLQTPGKDYDFSVSGSLITGNTGSLLVKLSDWNQAAESSWTWGITQVMGDNHNFYIVSNDDTGSKGRLINPGWLYNFSTWKPKIGWKIEWELDEHGNWFPIIVKK